jgi:signal transduction histidine kinase
MAAAETQEKYEYLIGTLVLLMVAGATFYGHRMAKQAQSDAAERERQSAELEASNRRLHAETQQRLLALHALHETNERLQSLFKRTLEAEEQQRRHVARELHEEVSQMLASLKMRLSVRQADVESLADSALDRLQDLVQDLAPHGMDLVGLAAVLPVHLQEWTRQSGLRVHFSEQLAGRPAFRIENAAYRVAQEAVSNVTRHANARNLRVELTSSAQELRLLVADDGRGFNPQAARKHAAFGLALMEQRIAMLGGSLEIRSKLGAGTGVLATFPLQQQIDWVGAPQSG